MFDDHRRDPIDPGNPFAHKLDVGASRFVGRTVAENIERVDAGLAQAFERARQQIVAAVDEQRHREVRLAHPACRGRARAPTKPRT